MTTRSQMSSATLGSKNEDKTRKRKRPDSLDEDIMDRSKESQSRPGSVQRNRIARTQEDAESTIPTGRLSPSLCPKEDRMDLSKQLQSRQESEHNKKLACKREDAENTILLDKMPEELLESSGENAKEVLSSVLAPSEEDRMDLSKQLQSRRESEHNKKLACKREEPTPLILEEPTPLIFIAKKKLKRSAPEAKKKLKRSAPEELEDDRNYAKDETQMSVDLIKPFQDQALVWVPPPPPDPPNPP